MILVTQDSEAEGLPIQSLLGLQTKFKASLGHFVRLCLKTETERHRETEKKRKKKTHRDRNKKRERSRDRETERHKET